MFNSKEELKESSFSWRKSPLVTTNPSGLVSICRVRPWREHLVPSLSMVRLTSQHAYWRRPWVCFRNADWCTADEAASGQKVGEAEEGAVRGRGLHGPVCVWNLMVRGTKSLEMSWRICSWLPYEVKAFIILNDLENRCIINISLLLFYVIWFPAWWNPRVTMVTRLEVKERKPKSSERSSMSFPLTPCHVHDEHFLYQRSNDLISQRKQWLIYRNHCSVWLTLTPL